MATEPLQRLRFAPSPTGSLHLGNARTALVNWLAARSRGGTLVLRIEDTDVDRQVAGAEERILGDLRWMGLDWDEGPDVGGPFAPYRQSERLHHYRAASDALLRSGAAYPCFCDSEMLRLEREAARARGEGWRYSGRCAELDADRAAARLRSGDAAAVRLRVPERQVRFVDGLRGETGIAAGEMDDFVAARADGSPTYLLAAVVDDHLMAIDHVIRGQDHLSNTPRQLLLYEALGWQPPRFTHLPLVLGADRARLSKRHGAASVADMRQAGVLAEALVNYLAVLGWEPPAGREILDATGLVDVYRIGDLSPTNVAFDADKLLWINQQHLQRLSGEELLRRARPFLQAAGLEPGDGAEVGVWWREALGVLVPGVHDLEELASRVVGSLWRRGAATVGAEDRSVLEAFLQHLDSVGDAAAFRSACDAVSGATGRRGRGLMHPLRVALTGEDAGPELSRLVPLLQRGSGLPLQPPLPGVGERLRAALAVPA